ncbi:MAG: hypothetical protein JSV05_09665 [Candidatus Bathyarchaeota archaeon]|nr:MAG: hypothetical protein JSV05_09665 [Candidatus Bathyarchaeota archaeon]
MKLPSMFEIRHKGLFFFTLFYLVAGILNLAVLGIYGLDLLHVALIAVLSLITSFGLYGLQRWSLWLVIGLFFITTTYGAFMLNAILTDYTSPPGISTSIAILAIIFYLIFTWIATIYIASNRKDLR